MILKEFRYIDVEWVMALNARSEKAFEMIFRKFYPELYRFAFAFLMNRDQAEDVVQEVFISLWAKAGSLPAETRIRPYLFSAVKHACLDYLKHIRVVDTNKQKLAEALMFSGTLEYEDDQEMIDLIKQKLESLPEQQRLVLNLKVLEGLNYKEIAQRLNISETTVHTHIKRAYQTIRKSFPLYLQIFLIPKL